MTDELKYGKISISKNVESRGEVVTFRDIKMMLAEKRNRLLLVVGGVLVIVVMLFCIGLFSPTTKRIEPELIAMSPTPTPAIVVDVKGNVMNPGVYTLPGGSRVQDAVSAAGGFVSEETGETVNLAKILIDGEMVVIGKMKVNLNTADQQELETLPGIGETLAKRIIEYRDIHGNFYSIEDIMQVKGIGEGTFQNLQDAITV